MTRNNQAKAMPQAGKEIEDTGEFTSADHRHPGSENLLPAWQKGQSGNPASRPRGARSKLSELALTKLLADFEIHGDRVIETVRTKAPQNYLAAIVSLLPKQQEKLDSPFADLTEEELQLLEDFLKSQRAIDVTPESST